jgi:hypothetical protein
MFLNQVKFELQVIQITEPNEHKIDIHIIHPCLRSYFWNEKKFWTTRSENMSTKVWLYGFKIFYKANEV